MIGPALHVKRLCDRAALPTAGSLTPSTCDGYAPSPGWSPTSHQSISFAPFDIRISSGRYQQAAYDELHARSREARVTRALLARLLLRRAVVGPDHGVKTHVLWSRNARAMRKSGYAVSLIHHMRPLNRRETNSTRQLHDPQSHLRAAFGRAMASARNA